MSNTSTMWKIIKKMDDEISSIGVNYSEMKKNEVLRLEGKRSTFFHCTEFGFDTNDFSEHKKSVQQSVDGIYVISRIGFQVYLEGVSDITGGIVRESMLEYSNIQLRNGFSSIVNQRGGHFASLTRLFDFEWKLEIGSSERSYCVDKNSDGFMSSRTLLSSGKIVSNEMEFSKPYTIKGNESWSLSVRSIFYNPNNANPPSSDKYIVSITTIGHKIIGTDFNRI